MKKDPVNVRSLVEKAVSPLLIPMELKEQTLELEGGEGVYFIGDAHWTTEALINILKNCMEHTPCGGRLQVTWEGNPIYTQIRIADTGEGIPKEDLPHIFTRFYRGRNAHEDSVGIGLAMAKSIILQQNGDITADSYPGRGTTFSIRFYKRGPGEAAGPGHGPERSPAEKHTSGMPALLRTFAPRGMRRRLGPSTLPSFGKGGRDLFVA